MLARGPAARWGAARAAAVAVGVAAGIAAGACTFGEREIAAGREQPVVHAVLNPVAERQFVLVERTLTGRATVREDSLPDAADPITSGGGVPVSAARVVVTDEATGATAVARERRVTPRGGGAPRGTGVYEFANLAAPRVAPDPTLPGVRVTPGGRYRLRIETPEQVLVTARTAIPGDARTALVENLASVTFLRDRDTLALRWPPVPGARSYALRIESPYGAFFLFSDTAAFRLTGELRNLFTERLPRVFQAGFTQRVYVAAVDTNFFDYYRSGNSPFTGSGIINRVDGGIGLFGGYVPVLERIVFVRATDRDPFDGRYVARGPAGPETLRLWVDTRAAGIAEVTGAYRLPTDDQFGVLGTLDGSRLRLRAVEGTEARVVNRTFDGEVRGDTLELQLRGAISPGDGGRRIFVRQRDSTAAPGRAP